MTGVIGLDLAPRPCPALRHPRPHTRPPAHTHARPHTHRLLTPSVKKLRSIRKLGTRFGSRLGSEDQE